MQCIFRYLFSNEGGDGSRGSGEKRRWRAESEGEEHRGWIHASAHLQPAYGHTRTGTYGHIRTDAHVDSRAGTDGCTCTDAYVDSRAGTDTHTHTNTNPGHNRPLHSHITADGPGVYILALGG